LTTSGDRFVAATMCLLLF